MAHYRAAKGALHEYGAALRAEVVGRGVAVTTLRLGTIDTPANRNAMPDTDRSSWHAVDAVVDGALRCCRPDAGDLPAFLSL